MAEPKGSKLPTSYDDASTLLGALIDQRLVTLRTAVDELATTIQTEENVADIETPCYLLFVDSKEIIFAQEIAADHHGFTNCLRGVRGSAAVAHTGGEKIALVVSGALVNQFRDAVIAGQRYQGLVGPESSLPAPTLVGQLAFATDTKKVLVCLTPGAWTWVGNRVGHADLDGRGDDDHTQYHNDARAQTWHNNLPGGHVTGGDNHDHRVVGDNTGAARVVAGLSSARPSTPTSVGQVYYETDTAYLYIAKNTTGSGWVRVVGTPEGTIVPFLEADLVGGKCPPGWERYTALDGRLVKGAPAGVTSPLNAGGVTTHTHTYSGVVAHYHPVQAHSAAVSVVDDHTHTIVYYGYGSYARTLKDVSESSAWTNYTEPAGEHNHKVTTPTRYTNQTKKTSDGSSGASSATSGSASSWPAFQEVVWCIKL